MSPPRIRQHVRTGCRTCKARKIKCDEAKPQCRRCASTGRKCGGYDTAASPQQSLTWYRPTQLAAHDQEEGRAFQFFSQMVGPVLSGPTSAYFWTHLVMQFSHFEPSVRHAVLSISSLYEGFSRGSRISRQLRPNPFAIAHYNAAIGRVKSSRNEQVILLLCILFVCIEYLRGDIDAALQHCRYGIAILNGSACSSWVRDHLLPIFRRLSFNPFFFGAEAVPLLLLSEIDTSLPARFNSVIEAQAAMDDLAAQGMECGPGGGGADDKQRLEMLLDEWQSRADDLESAIPASAALDRYSLCSVRVKHKVATITLQTPSKTTELWFDQHLDTFRSIVNLAQTAHRYKTMISQGGMARANFTFEMGFLPLLFFVVIKCRHLGVRLEALSWMVQLCAAKEGLLDVGTLYRVGRRHIEIEHGISLDDDGIAESDAPGRLPSEEERVFGAPVNHELEMYLDENGVVHYRREVHFLKRDHDGQVIDNMEYIGDDKPRRSRLQVPCMRSAL